MKTYDIFLRQPRVFDLCLKKESVQYGLSIMRINPCRYRLLSDMDDKTMSLYDDMSLEELRYIETN